MSEQSELVADSPAIDRHALAPDGGQGPLHVVVLGDWLGFPHGMAATSRARLLARALREAGVAVRVLILQASDRPQRVENTAVRGEYEGVAFEYACGTTVRHDSFTARRLIAAWGWLHGALRLLQLRREGQLDLVCLWFWTPRPAARLFCFMALLRLLRVPVVREVDESPWSLRGDATTLERLWSPLAGMTGAVVISADLHEWAGGGSAGPSPAAHRRRPDSRRRRRAAPRDYPNGDPVVVFPESPGYDRTGITFICHGDAEVWRPHPECRLAVTGGNPVDPDSGWLRDEAGERDRARRVGISSATCAGPELLDAVCRTLVRCSIPLFDDVRPSRFPTKSESTWPRRVRW